MGDCDGDYTFAAENAEQDGMRECLAECSPMTYIDDTGLKKCVPNCGNGFFEYEQIEGGENRTHCLPGNCSTSASNKL